MSKAAAVEESPSKASESATTALAVVTPINAITPTEQKEGDSRWEIRVRELRQMESEAHYKSLRWRWERGQFLNELMKDPRRYGNRTAESFAETFDIDKSLAYRELQFYTQYNEDGMQQLVARKISWRDVFYLIGVEDMNKREKLIEARVTGKLKSKELEVAVKKINQAKRQKKEAKGEKVDKRSGAVNLGQIFRSTVAIGNDYDAKLAEFTAALKDYAKLEDGKKKTELEGHIREAMRGFKAIAKRLEKLIGT